MGILECKYICNPKEIEEKMDIINPIPQNKFYIVFNYLIKINFFYFFILL